MADNHLHELKSNEQNVLPFKRKIDQKSNYKSATDDEDIDSAPSLKSNSNPPLPQLQRQKRKLVIKPFGNIDSKNQYGFIQKQVRQHDNILLKQRNNLVSSQNMKLKTRITILQKENQRLQKLIDNETSQLKPSTSYASRQKVRPADSTLRAVIRGLRKQIQDLKKENVNIKSTVKFTSMKQLETQRDHLAEQAIRLRLTLQAEISKRSSMKTNTQGLSALQNRLHLLSQRNSLLNREHAELLEKYKKLQESTGKSLKAIQNEKNLQKALTNARKTINERDIQIQNLKGQLKTNTQIGTSNSIVTPKQNKFQMRRPSIDRKNKIGVIPTRSQAKSSQKITNIKQTCVKCPKLEQQIKNLTQKCKKLESELQKINKGGLGEIARQPIQKVTDEEVLELRRFLTLRFKAHRLNYEQSEKYLINCEGNLDNDQKKKQMTARELMESLFVQPFCIVSNRYLEVLVIKLIYGDINQAIMLDQSKKLTKGEILEAYSRLMPKYDVMSQQKEEQMFIQVAQLITTYYQQIMAALTAKRNGEGTIPEKFFLDFFKEIELEQQYIDFIITQIILESLDMDHLNFYAMFEIFYMPQMTAPANQNLKKKKFEVSNENVVHEQDEQYQESKSHLGSRNKTLEHKEEQEDEYQWQQEQKDKKHHEQVKKEKQNTQKPKQEQQQYEEEYQQEKLQNEVVQPKAKSYVIDEYDQ